jgi:hypothetical protein
LHIELIASPAFFATKLDAFAGRGISDYRASHDLEDIISLINGRTELTDEIDRASSGLRAYLIHRSGELLAEPRFVDSIPWHLPGDPTSQLRVRTILDRLKRISLLS